MAKKILITGASSGIGEQTARYLSEQGYETVLVARNAEKLNCLVEQLSSPAYVYPLDLRKLDRIEEIFTFCHEEGLILDGLVHCAGVSANTPVRANVIEDMEYVFRLNYEAFVELVKYFSARKYSANGSSVVVMSSLACNVCKKGTVNYSASKTAVNTAVKVMAKELARRRIRVNSIMPGYVKTPMTDNIDLFNNVEEEQPLGMIEPEYIAYMIEFLLSDKSEFITGAAIPISGGMNY